MTVKGRRAAALRVATPRELHAARAPGGWVDDSLPDGVRGCLVDVVPTDRVDAFMRMFRARLGRYRASIEWKALSVRAELRLVDEALMAIEQTRLRIGNLPQAIGCEVRALAWTRERTRFHDVVARADSDLGELAGLLAHASVAVTSRGRNRGAPPLIARDLFLHDVACALTAMGIGSERAAGVAARTLRACGVTAPEDERKARAIVRKMEHLTIDRS